MIWTVAISAKRQPKYYLIDKKQNKTVETYHDESVINHLLFSQRDLMEKYRLHEVTGWERRAEPGDIIDFKPIEQEHIWTPYERTAFLIVTIYGATPKQMGDGMVESLWDLDSYIPYSPVSFEERELNIRSMEEEMLSSGRKLKKRWDDLPESEKQKDYEEYVANQLVQSSYPTKYLKKRRMGIELETLEEHGVDRNRMLDTKEFYDPKPRPFHFTQCFDKLKKRKLDASDNLKRIAKRDVLLGH